MLRKCSELTGCMEMYIKVISIFLIICLPVFAVGVWDVFLTTDKSLDEQLKFLDKLNTCEPYKYHAEPSGIYEIYGKRNKACALKWTIAECNFPEGVYQKFAEIQKHRAIERSDRYRKGQFIEIKDEEYRYLYETGNEYCIFRY